MTNLRTLALVATATSAIAGAAASTASAASIGDLCFARYTDVGPGADAGRWVRILAYDSPTTYQVRANGTVFSIRRALVVQHTCG